MLKALRFFGWPLLVGVLVALLIIQRYPQWVGLPDLDVNLQQAPQTATIQQGPVSYADAVDLAAPAVANLYTTKMVNKNSHPLFEDPQFRRFFGDNLPKQKRMESSLGSAVIMSSTGYLLTNNHVTAGADQIVVALKDGRETLARVIRSICQTCRRSPSGARTRSASVTSPWRSATRSASARPPPWASSAPPAATSWTSWA